MKYEPLPIEELRARIDPVTRITWTLEQLLAISDADMLKPYTFDFEDGTRLIATMIQHDKNKPPALLVSMSINPRIEPERLANWIDGLKTAGQPCPFKCAERIRLYTRALLACTDHKLGDMIDRGFTPANGAPFVVFEFTPGE